MPEYCDVALPVPLDMVFTYRVTAEATPVVGGRVLVSFRQQRLTGIVVELHDRKPSVATKAIFSALDVAPVLDDQLARRCISRERKDRPRVQDARRISKT